MGVQYSCNSPTRVIEALRHEHECGFVEVKGIAVWILNVSVDATRHHGEPEAVDQNNGLVELHSRNGKGRAANGNRLVDAANCRRERQTQGDMSNPPPHTSDPTSATPQVRRGNRPKKKRNRVPKTTTTKDNGECFWSFFWRSRRPGRSEQVSGMWASWVREHQRGHRRRDLERNGPAAPCSMRGSGGTHTTSALSKRTGSSQIKGGEGGYQTTQRQEAICTFWHRTRCTKYEC